MSSTIIRSAASTDERMGTGPPRLELRHVSATYREGERWLPVLDDVSLAVGDHEFVALIGSSGCGKSTLLDLAAGLLQPDAGEVMLDGQVTTARQRIGQSAYMQQRDLLLPWRTALANAALALEVAGMSRGQARRMAASRFPEFDLAGFEQAYPSQLSGGMRQRVAFLRTLLANRSLLLLDEPFGALDAMTRATMQTWLLERWERDRRAVLLVTHDVEEAIFLADRVVVLSPRPGRVVHETSISLSRPRHRGMVAEPEFAAHRATILDAVGLL